MTATFFGCLNDIINVKCLTEFQACEMCITIGFVIIDVLFMNTKHPSLSCVYFYA